MPKVKNLDKLFVRVGGIVDYNWRMYQLPDKRAIRNGTANVREVFKDFQVVK